MNDKPPYLTYTTHKAGPEYEHVEIIIAKERVLTRSHVGKYIKLPYVCALLRVIGKMLT